MKRVLVVCDYYAPENEIASIRITKLAKYLKRAGYDVNVLTEKKEYKVKDTILEADAEGIPVVRFAVPEKMKRFEAWYYRVTKKYREKRYNDVSNRIHYDKKLEAEVFLPFETRYPLIGTMDSLLRLLKDYTKYRETRIYLKEKSKEYDVCFSSYGFYFSHFVGNYIKKCNPGIQWIADFRDAVYQPVLTPRYFAPVAKCYEKWACNRCDKIVVVSEGIKRELPKKFRGKANCITNGFDKEDRRVCEYKKQDKFKVCYTGRMYGGIYDVALFFQAIRELIQEGIIEENKIEVCYAGTGFSVLSSQAKQHNLQHICKDYGVRGRKETVKLQAESNILLMATWDYKKKNVGRITGKVLEYMMHGIPIVSIVHGDIENHQLTCILRENGIGESCEESCLKADFPRLKKYVKNLYLQWSECDSFEIPYPKEETIVKFEYQHLAKSLADLIEEQ